MPPVSEAQRRAMWAAATGHSTLGIPRAVGKEFVGDEATAGHAAGTLFVAPDGDVLLLRRSSAEANYAGHWALPGGKAEDGETPEVAAAREAREELGTAVPDGARKLIDQRVTPTGMAFHTFAQPVEKKFAPELNEEHSGYAWAPLDQLPQPLHPGVAATLQDRLLPEGAADMSPEEWTELRSGFAKWTREEEKEAEHADDADQAHDAALVEGFDRFAFDRESVRVYDADGRLHVERTPISKANICEYRGAEIPNSEQLGLDPMRKYRLLRHPDELRRAADTFNNIPLLRRHVPASAVNHPYNDAIGATGTDAEFEHPYLYNSLVVWPKDDIEGIEDEEKKELSSAYRYRADMTPGTYEGEPYDGVMRDIVGNHVALVKEGRAGPDVVVGDSMENLNMPKAVLTRKAALVQGAIAAFLATRLAADAKLDVTPLLLGVDHKNFPKKRTAIAAGVTNLTAGKLAKDAKLDGLDKVLLALDAVEPEEEAEKKDKAEDEDLPKPGGGKGDGPAKDRAARDEAKEGLKEMLKGKLNAEDYKAACDEIDGMEAEDEEKDDEDERPDPEDTNRGDKAKDRRGKDEEPAMTKKAMDEAIAGERQRQRDVREAERFVRGWVGDLAIAYDSAEDVYKAAIEARGKSTKGIHPSAYRTILEMLPKPGAEHHAGRTPRIGMDEAAASDFATRFPDAQRVRLNS